MRQLDFNTLDKLVASNQWKAMSDQALESIKSMQTEVPQFGIQPHVVLPVFQNKEQEQYVLAAGTEQRGPFTLAQIRELLKADAITPVVKFSFPPQRGYVVRDGFVRYLHPEHAKTRSQDLEPMYHDVGQYYFSTVESFKRVKCFAPERLGFVVISDEEVQDIDTPSDWATAELKYRMLHQG